MAATIKSALWGAAARLRGGGREPTGLARAAEAAWKIPLRAALKHNSPIPSAGARGPAAQRDGGGDGGDPEGLREAVRQACVVKGRPKPSALLLTSQRGRGWAPPLAHACTGWLFKFGEPIAPQIRGCAVPGCPQVPKLRRGTRGGTGPASVAKLLPQCPGRPAAHGIFAAPLPRNGKQTGTAGRGGRRGEKKGTHCSGAESGKLHRLLGAKPGGNPGSAHSLADPQVIYVLETTPEK